MPISIDYLLDTAFRFGLVRRVAWCLLRRGVAADRLGSAFGRDLARQATTRFGRELVRVLTVVAHEGQGGRIGRLRLLAALSGGLRRGKLALAGAAASLGRRLPDRKGDQKCCLLYRVPKK